ncbi:hypothetical protein RHS04_00004, partial [Rhizoctonia solani]
MKILPNAPRTPKDNTAERSIASHWNPTMFSPAANSIRQRLLGRIITTSLEHPPNLTDCERIEDAVKDLDPGTLSGADEVAFYDLQEHEDRYEVLLSTSFDFSSLAFTQNLAPTSTPTNVDVESIINALPANNPGTQKFVYRLNAMKMLLGCVQATQCAHPALMGQRSALITALTVDIDDFVQSGMNQWALCTTEATKRHGLRVVHAANRRDFVYSSPLALSIMVLTALIHSIMGVSRESCDFILASLKAILLMAANMQDAQAQRFIMQHLSHAPNTLATTLHLLNLPPPLQLYVVCPHCSALYQEFDHAQLPGTCTARNFDSPVC